MTILFTGKAAAKNGRNGQTQTTDGRLSFTMLPPDKVPKDSKSTNPEELFACAYAACFGGALAAVAEKNKTPVKDVKVSAEVSLNKEEEKGFFLSAVLDISIPGLDESAAEKLVQEAHKVCPYSKATRNNVDVTLKVNNHQLAKAA